MDGRAALAMTGKAALAMTGKAALAMTGTLRLNRLNRLNRVGRVHRCDLILGVAEFGQHFIGVLTQQG